MKEPLILLPGMMCDGRLFAPQLAALSGQWPIMVAPLRGHDSIKALAGRILEIAPPHFALAGLSMGGIVAMEIIGQAPERVTRLALMDTNARADPPNLSQKRQEQVARVRAGALHEVMRDEMKPTYLAKGASRPDILQLCMEMALSLGPEIFADQSEALRTRPDQCAILRSVRVPSLILCGEADTRCPPALHEFMRDLIKGARLEIIPKAGHLPTIEQAEQTNKVLKEWLMM